MVFLKTAKRIFTRDRVYQTMMYTALVVFAVIILVPVGWTFMASIKATPEHYGNPWALPSHIHWENFVQAWNTSNMGTYMGYSVLVTGLSLILLLIVALPASYCLARFQFVGKKFLKTCFMAGLFINVNYLVVPLYLMLNDGNKWFIANLGNKFTLLNNHFIVAVIYAATALPFTIYLLTSYFQTLPRDFEEAAYIDGASYGKTMLSIMLPMAKPSVITVVLFNFLSFWNEYIIVKTLITDRNIWTLPAGLLNLMQAQQSSANYGPLYAGLVMVMLPVLILYIFLQKNLTKGMTVGGVKG